jgi:hypothetical protein
MFIEATYPRCRVHHGPREGTDVTREVGLRRGWGGYRRPVASVWCDGGADVADRRGSFDDVVTSYKEAGGGGRGRERAR